MKKSLLRISALIICAVMALSLCACEEAVVEDNSELLSSAKLADGKSVENANLKMEWNAAGKCVVFTDKKTGAVWSTTPDEFLKAETKPARARNYLESPMIIEFYNSELEEPDTVRAYTHCLKDNNISAELKDKTITVGYYFKEANFYLELAYTLADDHFSISCDTNKIHEGNNQIYSIKLAPYVCSVATGTENSYLFFPSGSGTLIDTSKANLKQFEMNADIYGPDAARKIKEKLTNDKNVYLPVYGVKKGDNALLAVVSSGEESAALTLSTNEELTGYSRVSPELYIRGYDYNTIKGNLTYEETSIYAKEPLKDTVFTMDFYSLGGADANYAGMARKYQEVLYSDNKATGITDSTYSLKVIGGLMQQKNFLGYPYKTLLAVTKYTDISKMLEELEGSGEKPNVQLYGFGATGLDVGQVAGGFKLGGAFGSTKELNSLMSYCAENGIDAFVDFNLVQFGSNGSGYSAMFDAAKTANRQAAYQYYISKSVQTQDSALYGRYRLLKRDCVIEAAGKLLKKIEKYSLPGVSFASLSDTAYSDYTKSDYFMKKGYRKMAQDIIASYKDSGYKVAANGANAYAASVADCIFEAPLNSSEYDVFTVDVPFYELVFKGKTKLTSESVNAGEPLAKKELQALETGASMLFTVYDTYYSELSFSQFKGLYGGLFESNKKDILAAAEKYGDYYKAISGQTIADHQLITNDVRLTTYSNGVKIYVNYGDEDYTSEAGTVKAMDCLIIK